MKFDAAIFLWRVRTEGTGTFILACESLNAECYGAVSVYTQRTYMYTSSVFRDELSDWLPPCVTASTDHMGPPWILVHFVPKRPYIDSHQSL